MDLAGRDRRGRAADRCAGVAPPADGEPGKQPECGAPADTGYDCDTGCYTDFDSGINADVGRSIGRNGSASRIPSKSFSP